MTRIGKVTLKVEDGLDYARRVVQEITEDGKRRRAVFKYEGLLVGYGDGEISLAPGAVNIVTHVRYRRAA